MCVIAGNEDLGKRQLCLGTLLCFKIDPTWISCYFYVKLNSIWKSHWNPIHIHTLKTSAFLRRGWIHMVIFSLIIRRIRVQCGGDYKWEGLLMNVMKYSYALSFYFLPMSFAHLIHEFRQGNGEKLSTSLGVLITCSIYFPFCLLTPLFNSWIWYCFYSLYIL